MLADLIREFCNSPENDYEAYENYSRTFDETTVTTIGILAKEDASYLEIVGQLTSFLEAKGFDDATMSEIAEQLDGADMDQLDSGVVVYFPAIRDYRPLQP